MYSALCSAQMSITDAQHLGRKVMAGNAKWGKRAKNSQDGEERQVTESVQSLNDEMK